MAQKSRSNNKANFQTGDIPNQSNYVDLIDSFVVLTNDTNSGSLTLSGSLITSGSINHNGSTVFGDSSTDTHTITGNITASGGISSSGTVVGNVGTFTSYTNANFGSSNFSTTGTSTFNNITASGNISSSGTITAPIISSSGTITAEGLVISDDANITDTLTIGGNITASGNISSSGIITAADGTNNGFHIGTGEVALDANSNNLRLGVDATWTGITIGKANAPTKTISLHGPVTASGNISSSGTITANKIESDNLFSHVGDANTGLQLGSDTVTIEGNDIEIAKFTSTYIELNQHVTASDNISSSGTVIGLSGSFNNLAYGGTDLSVSATELNYWDGLTSAEATQVKNIAGSTISGTQWSYLGQLNQSVTTTSTVSFAGVSMSSQESFSGNFNLGALEISATKSFLVTLSDIDTILAGETSNPFTFTLNSRILSTSVIIGTVVEQDLIVDIFGVVDGGFKIILRNPRSSPFTGGNCKINFIVL